AGIVVLGTVGRTGLSAAFLGNTAEQVIDHLRCDLLVIKPDEYETIRHQHRIGAGHVKTLFNIVPEAAVYLGNRDVCSIAKSTVF
ncbi:BtpA/SgcQ family protein, partial [Salmonella enterica]|uniref:BtpA/SgcQ family protein n=1 Tax=Salmonella enterica TaxID=28901 RepID=UPI001F10A9BC